MKKFIVALGLSFLLIAGSASAFNIAYEFKHLVPQQIQPILDIVKATIGTLIVNGNAQINGNLTANNFYGGAWNFTEDGWIMSFGASGTYYNITRFRCDMYNGFDCANGTGTLTAQSAGIYLISSSISSTGLAGGSYGMCVAKNSANCETQGKCYSRFSGTAEAMEVSTKCFMRLNVGDHLNVMVDDEASPTKDLTIYSQEITALRVAN